MSILIAFLALSNMLPSNANYAFGTTMFNGKASISVELSTLLIQPPKGGVVVIENFTALSATQEELSATSAKLNSALVRVASTESELKLTTSALSAALDRITALEAATWNGTPPANSASTSSTSTSRPATTTEKSNSTSALASTSTSPIATTASSTTASRPETSG